MTEAPLTPPADPNAAILEKAAEAAEVAQSVVKVDLQFPLIGFIDPATEIEKMRRLVDAMTEGERLGYPEKIRAQLIAHHSNPTAVANPSDEELALAIFIKRTTDSALTQEDFDAKATGRKPKAPGSTAKPKEPKKSLDDLLGGL